MPKVKFLSVEVEGDAALIGEALEQIAASLGGGSAAADDATSVPSAPPLSVADVKAAARALRPEPRPEKSVAQACLQAIREKPRTDGEIRARVSEILGREVSGQESGANLRALRESGQIFKEPDGYEWMLAKEK